MVQLSREEERGGGKDWRRECLVQLSREEGREKAEEEEDISCHL